MSVLSKLEGFTVQEISNSIWAMAKLAYYDESLLDKVSWEFPASSSWLWMKDICSAQVHTCLHGVWVKRTHDICLCT